MDTIRIERRREYELHVKHVMRNKALTNKQKAFMRKVAMQCFDDGIDFIQGKLYIKVEL